MAADAEPTEEEAAEARKDAVARSALSKLLGQSDEELTEEELEYLRAQPQL